MIILYSDKTCLGSFTDQKAHGIYMTLANIPVCFLYIIKKYS